MQLSILVLEIEYVVSTQAEQGCASVSLCANLRRLS